MARQSDKRKRLVEAADRLIHTRGYDRSSIADIAREADVPAGNVYYYFKTKDEMVQAVIAARNARSAEWLKELDIPGAPRESLLAFINAYEDSRKERAKTGCAIGSLCQETNKIGGSLAGDAGSSFEVLLNWLTEKFSELGDATKAAKANAQHLLGSLQGAVLLAQTFGEPKMIKAECKRLRSWVENFSGGHADESAT
jgi:AcrR family transcriptional regulator